MNKVEPKIKQFLSKTEGLPESTSATDEFLEVLKRENIRQIKEQLAVDLAPLQDRLANIERQQAVIIRLLERKLDLNIQEKRIMDLLETKLKES